MIPFLLLIVAFAVNQAEDDCPAMFEEVQEDGSVVNIIPFMSGCKGLITSPGFPTNYLSSSTLEWRVRSNESEGVTVLQVRSLRLEPIRDVLEIIEDHEETVTTTSLHSEIDSYGRLVPLELSYYRSHSSPTLRVVFSSDNEVDAAGFNISYAFNDCVALDDIEHGVLQEVLYNSEVQYRIQCDEGYQVGDRKGAHEHHYVDQASVPLIYCDRAEGSWTRYQWINSEYFCGKIVSGCTEHPILNGRLETIHTKHYKVICDCVLCSVIGPVTLECVERSDGRLVWEGLQNEHGAEYPQCVAHTCATPQASPSTLILKTSSSSVPGSYYRERCIDTFIPDVTRWCLSTGEWTAGFAEGECV